VKIEFKIGSYTVVLEGAGRGKFPVKNVFSSLQLVTGVE
jgi:hypothetical protein